MFFLTLLLAKKTGHVTADHDDHQRKRENRAQRSDRARDRREKEKAQQQIDGSVGSVPEERGPTKRDP
ncbi:MAG TPA: hypothetical protein VIE64_02195 [Solirubrobacterales bacterium]